MNWEMKALGIQDFFFTGIVCALLEGIHALNDCTNYPERYLNYALYYWEALVT